MLELRSEKCTKDEERVRGNWEQRAEKDEQPRKEKKRGTNKLTGKEAQELSSLTNKRKSKVCPTESFVYPLSMSAASKANSPALGLHFSKMCS